jgi:aminopeptidase-like protein
MTSPVVESQSAWDVPERDWVETLFDRLFPICRSIAGPGLRESLAILSEVLPLQVEGFLTGTPVFDWESARHEPAS